MGAIDVQDDSIIGGMNQQIAGIVEDLRAESAAGVDSYAIGVKDVVGLVPGAQYASFTLVDERRTVATLDWTHYRPVCVDEIQQIHLEGPCLHHDRRNQTVLVDDLSADTRWPRFCRAVLDRTPIRSVLSFEAFAVGDMAGFLNVYAEQAYAFTTESIAVGMVCAAHLVGGQYVVDRGRDMLCVLASADLREQAKGMLMQRFGIRADAASRLLERLERDNVPALPITVPFPERLTS